MTKLSIKEELRAIDCRDFGWWDSLTEEEKKKIGLWQLMRFTSSVNSSVNEIEEHYLISVNEFVNVNFNILKNEPQLQHRLLQVVGVGSAQYHGWVAPPKQLKKAKTKNKKLLEFFKEVYLNLSLEEIDMILAGSTKAEIKEKLLEYGLTDKEIKALIK